MEINECVLNPHSMVYRIVSDISSFYDIQESSFCIKIINGIVLTYTGRFKTWNPRTPHLEIQASAIGLSMIEENLKSGDSVVVYSDTTLNRHAKSIDFPYLRTVTKRLWKRGVHVHFIPTNDKERKNQYSHYYIQCHQTARRKMIARRHNNDEYNNQYEGSKIWDVNKS